MSAGHHGHDVTAAEELLHDAEVEQWLRDVVLPIAEATKAEPSRSTPAAQVVEQIAARRARRA